MVVAGLLTWLLAAGGWLLAAGGRAGLANANRRASAARRQLAPTERATGICSTRVHRRHQWLNFT